jgi:hypothetical protein
MQHTHCAAPSSPTCPVWLWNRMTAALLPGTLHCGPAHDKKAHSQIKPIDVMLLGPVAV